jgi:hypothetical protein
MAMQKKKKTGNIGRPPREICKVCGKKKINPEMTFGDRWRYPRDRTCLDCLTKIQDEN